MCWFGHSSEHSPCVRRVVLDSAHTRGSLGRMAELLPEPRKLARALLAGLFAWVLAIQGLAAAQNLAAVAPGLSPTDIALCSTDNNGEEHTPDRHAPCTCCILCPSCHHLGGMAWMPAFPPKGLDFHFPRIAGTLSRRVVASEILLLPGWTSSWSQRAPPRLA